MRVLTIPVPLRSVAPGLQIPDGLDEGPNSTTHSFASHDWPYGADYLLTKQELDLLWKQIYENNHKHGTLDPRGVQSAVLGAHLKATDCFVISGTGSGKTAAGTIPELYHKNGLTILIVPLTNLAIEITASLKEAFGDDKAFTSCKEHTAQNEFGESSGLCHFSDLDDESTSAVNAAADVVVESLFVDFGLDSDEAKVVSDDCTWRFWIVTPEVVMTSHFN